MLKRRAALLGVVVSLISMVGAFNSKQWHTVLDAAVVPIADLLPLDPAAGDSPQVVATSNIGCLTHLQSGTATPVRHWIEIVADRLAG